MERLFVVLAGLALASFINSLAYRVPRGVSIIHPPSYCTGCGRAIRPYDLVPVVSWLLLRGRCRHCGGRIPASTLAVEIAIPLAYFLLHQREGLGALFFVHAYLIGVLAYLSLVDIEWRSLGIAESMMPAAGGCVLLWLAYHGQAINPVSHYLYGAAGGCTLLCLSFAVVYAFKKSPPLGPADLLAVPGVSLYFGLNGVVRVMIAASLLGIAAGAFLLVTRRVDRGFKYPLIPFLTVGVLLEVLVFS